MTRISLRIGDYCKAVHCGGDCARRSPISAQIPAPLPPAFTSTPGGERARKMGGFIVDMKIMIITVVIAGILV